MLPIAMWFVVQKMYYCRPLKKEPDKKIEKLLDSHQTEWKFMVYNPSSRSTVLCDVNPSENLCIKHIYCIYYCLLSLKHTSSVLIIISVVFFNCWHLHMLSIAVNCELRSSDLKFVHNIKLLIKSYWTFKKLSFLGHYRSGLHCKQLAASNW